MKSIQYTKSTAFINRERELTFLQQWINKIPENILFIYGPKSSGKTTLLYKFIAENLNSKKYDIKHFNLREILISNYKDFLKIFFKIDYSKNKKDIKEKREYNIKVFKLSVETLKGLESKELDPFDVMKQEFIRFTDSNIKPVLIIDELQALENIYFNGQRELLKELFNFFVAMTKESHLCHIIISSSDGYFIERIYEDSKLRKSSIFLEVDYLPEKDIVYWLNNLKKESKITNLKLSDHQIKRIWYYFGGSVWEVSNFLSSLMDLAENNSVDDEILENEAKRQIYEFRSNFSSRSELDEPKITLYKLINKLFQENKSFQISDLAELIADNLWNRYDLKEELKDLVRCNFIVYDPTKAKFKSQGHSIALGLKMFCEEII